MTNKAYIFAGGALVLGAAAIGTAIGVLFAPRTGRETRARMGQWLKQRREQGRVEYKAMREALDAGRKAFH